MEGRHALSSTSHSATSNLFLSKFVQDLRLVDAHVLYLCVSALSLHTGAGGILVQCIVPPYFQSCHALRCRAWRFGKMIGSPCASIRRSHRAAILKVHGEARRRYLNVCGLRGKQPPGLPMIGPGGLAADGTDQLQPSTFVDSTNRYGCFHPGRACIQKWPGCPKVFMDGWFEYS